MDLEHHGSADRVDMAGSTMRRGRNSSSRRRGTGIENAGRRRIHGRVRGMMYDMEGWGIDMMMLDSMGGMRGASLEAPVQGEGDNRLMVRELWFCSSVFWPHLRRWPANGCSLLLLLLLYRCSSPYPAGMGAHVHRRLHPHPGWTPIDGYEHLGPSGKGARLCTSA